MSFHIIEMIQMKATIIDCKNYVFPNGKIVKRDVKPFLVFGMGVLTELGRRVSLRTLSTLGGLWDKDQ